MFILIFSQQLHAAPLTIDQSCTKLNQEIPILAGGRVKPLYVLALDTMKFLTGKGKPQTGESSINTICSIYLNTQKEIAFDFPILVEHVETKKLLGIKEEEKTVDYKVVLDNELLIRSEIVKIKENNSIRKDLIKTFNRTKIFLSIQSGEIFQIYTAQNDNYDWSPLNTLENTELVSALLQSSKDYKNNVNDDYLLELTYVKSHVFSWSILITLAALFLTVLLKNYKFPIALAAITLLVQTTGIVMRVLISGRAPITNMYETVMFSGYGALIIALVILYFKREKIFLIAGLGYNILCLFMMMFANSMLNASIEPLVPVLRDNFWLSTHVTTIILSYAALALSWMIANITLFKKRLNKISDTEYKYNQSLTYTCIKVGVVLLSAGIILGGVWADYSWGRFWGWDPKETWSLIVLLFYTAVMHGRYTQWINHHRFLLLSAAGFMSVMMAWFGVNYILASGLHSYGFSEGGAIFLGTFFLIQTSFLLLCIKENKTHAKA